MTAPKMPNDFAIETLKKIHGLTEQQYEAIEIAIAAIKEKSEREEHNFYVDFIGWYDKDHTDGHYSTAFYMKAKDLGDVVKEIAYRTFREPSEIEVVRVVKDGAEILNNRKNYHFYQAGE